MLGATEATEAGEVEHCAHIQTQHWVVVVLITKEMFQDICLAICKQLWFGKTIFVKLQPQPRLGVDFVFPPSQSQQSQSQSPSLKFSTKH